MKTPVKAKYSANGKSFQQRLHKLSIGFVSVKLQIQMLIVAQWRLTVDISIISTFDCSEGANTLYTGKIKSSKFFFNQIVSNKI